MMKNLKKLDAEGSCGIDQRGINGLDLETLVISKNNKITDWSFMKNLHCLIN